MLAKGNMTEKSRWTPMPKQKVTPRYSRNKGDEQLDKRDHIREWIDGVERHSEEWIPPRKRERTNSENAKLESLRAALEKFDTNLSIEHVRANDTSSKLL